MVELVEALVRWMTIPAIQRSVATLSRSHGITIRLPGNCSRAPQSHATLGGFQIFLLPYRPSFPMPRIYFSYLGRHGILSALLTFSFSAAALPAHAGGAVERSVSVGRR
jgi:hypothetical protein